VRTDPALAALAVAAALLLWSPAANLRRQRARRVTGRSRQQRPPRGHRRTRPAARRHVSAAVAGLGVALLLGGLVGALAGLMAAGAAEWLLRRAPDGTDTAGLSAALPVGCDLLAVCLAAGVPPGAALAAVAAAVPEPLGDHLRRVAALYRLGAEPARAWSGTAPALHPLARVFVRVGESGSAAGPALRALATDLRSEERSRAQARVQRAGVWVLAPLGACFLPAFLCLGVVPLVLGIAGTVFH